MNQKPLVAQPSWWPTRKMFAMAIAFVITNVLKGLADKYFPGADFTDTIAQFGVFIEGAVVFLTGYLVRNRSVV